MVHSEAVGTNGREYIAYRHAEPLVNKTKCVSACKHESGQKVTSTHAHHAENAMCGATWLNPSPMHLQAVWCIRSACRRQTFTRPNGL